MSMNRTVKQNKCYTCTCEVSSTKVYETGISQEAKPRYYSKRSNGEEQQGHIMVRHICVAQNNQSEPV